MAMMRRERPIDRSKHERDARLFVIASEDTYAVKQYFDALAQHGVYDSRKVSVVISPTEDGRSSPKHLVARLDEYKRRNDARWKPIDEFWIVFDVDRHRGAELSDFLREAKSKSYPIAGSNPCFEVWLLLHETDDLTSVTTFDDSSTAAADCAGILRGRIGTYSKKNLDASRYTSEAVQSAVARASHLDDGHEWPQTVGSHVHRLIKAIFFR